MEEEENKDDKKQIEKIKNAISELSPGILDFCDRVNMVYSQRELTL